MIISGRVWCFGDNIDTDQIIPSQYLVLPAIKEMSRHAMEPQQPDFAKMVKPGDIIVAGQNFGCGSSREQAPAVLKHLGISAIIARSFARIFFRNCINTGLIVIETAEAKNISEGDHCEIDIKEGRILNRTKNLIIHFPKYPDFIENLVKCGGLVNYYKSQKR